jgi:predicted 2-oxoglutarate/Fe(II)-dependent dioxygenase YbiX
MINIWNDFLLSDEYSNTIKLEYTNKLQPIESNIRKQKNYHILDCSSWIHDCVNELILKNIGNNYCLVDRVTILKYEVGDFFLEHEDGPSNTRLNPNLPNHFYGGVELSERDEFIGGEFFINDKNVDFKKGRMFTHGFSDSHGVTMVTHGTRWSLHFLIKNNKIDLI